MADIPRITLFSDGGARPNPGPGGFGTILRCGAYEKEFSQGYCKTTNNRMELMGAITGLEKLNQKSHVTVFSDSKYLVDAVEKGWAQKWRRNNWMRNKREKAVNTDLWERLLNLLHIHSVTFTWVKGHAGHRENERCDRLAAQAISSLNRLEDTGFCPE